MPNLLPEVKMQIVIDTNVLVSCLFNQNSKVHRILLYLIDGKYQLLYSEETMRELEEVLFRPRISRNILKDWDIAELIALLRFLGIPILVKTSISFCRDPEDDKFLELAVDGHADYIVSGDKDLLILNSFRGIAIITPAAFLKLFESE
jgi:putative PIN family toxin of toxin-antitoxin system